VKVIVILVECSMIYEDWQGKENHITRTEEGTTEKNLEKEDVESRIAGKKEGKRRPILGLRNADLIGRGRQ